METERHSLRYRKTSILELVWVTSDKPLRKTGLSVGLRELNVSEAPRLVDSDV
jgi:hypothetical protein